MMRTTPRRFTTRQLSQIGFTLDRTFTSNSPEPVISGQLGMIRPVGTLRKTKPRLSARAVPTARLSRRARPGTLATHLPGPRQP